MKNTVAKDNKKLHTDGMNSIQRQSVRYPDIGRVDAPDLCALPGVLDNISAEGCKIHYVCPVVVDLDNDYELVIHPTRKETDNPFTLLCHPQWVKEDKGLTEIGFSILRSPDFAKLAEYVRLLNSDDEAEDSNSQIAGSVCKVI